MTKANLADAWQQVYHKPVDRQDQARACSRVASCPDCHDTAVPVQPFPSVGELGEPRDHAAICAGAVRMRNVSMRFGGVRALEDVHLDVLPGEVHALAGRERRRQVDDPEDPARRAAARLPARSRSAACR